MGTIDHIIIEVASAAAEVAAAMARSGLSAVIEDFDVEVSTVHDENDTRLDATIGFRLALAPVARRLHQAS